MNFMPFNFKIWGTFFDLGFITGFFITWLEVKRKKLGFEHFIDLVFIILVGGIIGSRLGYVLVYFKDFITKPLDILRLDQGGMGFYGGFLLVLLVGWIYIKIKKLNFWQWADIFTPGLAIGYAITRIGCFLLHEHLGKPTTVPWGIEVYGVKFHDTALYSIIAGLLIFIILLLIRRKAFFENRPGTLFLFFILCYSMSRFVIEFFAAGPYWWGMTVSQIVSMVLFLIVGGLVFLRIIKNSKHQITNNIQ